MNRDSPRVSVIIATYNWCEALRLSIRSALRQTFQDFELIVVGDACTDASADVVAEFADARVLWHNLSQNSGSQVAPNNAGLQMARGEYVAYLGHDDLWCPTHLTSMVDAITISGADVACGGMILYGPPGSGIRGIAGVLAPRPGERSRFTPPSAVMHQRALVDEIGPWSDHRNIRLPPDRDFLVRAWQHRQAFTVNGRISVLKLPAAWRADTYRTKDVRQHAELLRRMESEPDFLERELLDVVLAYASSRSVDVDLSQDAPPGELVERSKRFKGIESNLPPEARTASLRFTFAESLAGLEWHGPESDPRHGTFQWSGPGTQSSVQLPLVTDQDLRLTTHIIHSLAPDVLDSLQLEVNSVPIPLIRRTDEHGTTQFDGLIPAPALAKTTGHSRITFLINRTIVPADVNTKSTDRRRLGLAFNWIEVKPAGPYLPDAVPH
jgi:hypothetical protein